MLRVFSLDCAAPDLTNATLNLLFRLPTSMRSTASSIAALCDEGCFVDHCSHAPLPGRPVLRWISDAVASTGQRLLFLS